MLPQSAIVNFLWWFLRYSQSMKQKGPTNWAYPAVLKLVVFIWFIPIFIKGAVWPNKHAGVQLWMHLITEILNHIRKKNKLQSFLFNVLAFRCWYYNMLRHMTVIAKLVYLTLLKLVQINGNAAHLAFIGKAEIFERVPFVIIKMCEGDCFQILKCFANTSLLSFTF